MLKYVSKFTLDILPSLVATIIGAYIVNHYIVAKPGADAPVAAAASTADPKAEAKVAPDKAVKLDSDAASDVANIPEAGVKAKGISEKAILEKAAAEKSADKPSETASIPVETRHHQPAPREKALAKATPVAPTVAPVVTTPSAAAPSETAPALEDRRDANDLARAAIDRLRGPGETPRTQDAARVPDAPRVQEAVRVPEAPRVVPAPSLQPLPPPIMVSAPPVEAKPPYVPALRNDDSRRPTPPADIPSRPLDLRAEAMEQPSAREHTSVAEDMLSAAKSVFHAVLPK